MVRTNGGDAAVRDDRVYLRYIAESLRRVGEYLTDSTGARSQDLFFNDLRTQDAVLRRIKTLAEAASHLSPALRARYPDVAWREIGDFRNVLAHGYTNLHLDLVWETITADLPQLLDTVDSELADEPS
jgi:uncharacterized protein with HEPN domain